MSAGEIVGLIALVVLAVVCGSLVQLGNRVLDPHEQEDDE